MTVLYPNSCFNEACYKVIFFFVIGLSTKSQILVPLENSRMMKHLCLYMGQKNIW